MQLSNAPAQIVEAWATGDSSKTNPIPIPSQISVKPGAASWTDGFPPLCNTPLASGGIPPAKADMNGGLYQMSAVDVWMCAGAGFPYSPTFSSAVGGYPKFARVLKSAGDGYWISIVDNNVTDPDTGGAGWVGELVPSGVTPGSYSNVTVNAAGQVVSAQASTQSDNLAGAGRVSGTTYTNGSEFPIFVEVVGEQVSGASGNGFLLSAVVNGQTVQVNGPLLNDYTGEPGYGSVSFRVPPGAAYSVTLTNYATSPTPTIVGWYEVS